MSDSPDFDSIKQISAYNTEFWSARELMGLLGYSQWRNFETAIRRAQTSCSQTGQNVADHFVEVSKKVTLGSGAEREVKDYFLSRLACYLIAENGDPRKSEIAAAQNYFAIVARTYELQQLKEEQDERLRLRQRVADNNVALNEAAARAGVLPKSFGIFHNAGYEAMYGGLSLDQIKERKGIAPKADLLDHAGRAELAANDFRITQAEERLRTEGIIGQARAIRTHREVGENVRNAIIANRATMPEDLPAEPTIRPLLNEQQRKRKNLAKPKDEGQPNLWDQSSE